MYIYICIYVEKTEWLYSHFSLFTRLLNISFLRRRTGCAPL